MNMQTNIQAGLELVERVRRGDMTVPQLDEMLAQKPDLRIADEEDGLTALLWAVRLGRADIAARLIDAGAEPAQRTKECGLDAVAIAAIYDQPETLSVLVRRGCLLGKTDDRGWYPVQHAVDGNCVQTLEILLRERPDFMLLKDDRGRSLADIARSQLRHAALALLQELEPQLPYRLPGLQLPVPVRKFKPKGPSL